ncbi:flocculation protein FLO11-like, partial [Pollicipes pollicipes]|uniref:flocculation protein FLO11-like n=1 Tax=Pollicipes pollicipes TaxID=41117 RepID=UPI0018852DC5
RPAAVAPPDVEINDIDAEFGTVAPSRSRKRPVSATARLEQRTRAEGRRRRPARIQAVPVQVPDEEEVIKSAPAVAPVQQQRSEEGRNRATPSRRRFRPGRRVKKIKRIINPSEDTKKTFDNVSKDDENSNVANKEFVKSEVKPDQLAEKDLPKQSPTTNITSPQILRRKKIFRGAGRDRQSGGRTRNNSRRQFANRRRVVTPVPPTTTDAGAIEPTDKPLVVLSTSSPFEPFPSEENELDDGISAPNTQKETSRDADTSAFAFTKSTASGPRTASSSASGASDGSQPPAGTALDSSSPSGSGPSPSENTVDSGTSPVSTSTQDVLRRRPLVRGSARGGSRTVTSSGTRGGQRTTGGSTVSRGGGPRRRTQVSGSSSASDSSGARPGTSRRQFARRRRPSGSVNAVTSRAPTTTTSTTAATTTTRIVVIDAGGGASTVQTFGPGGFTFTSSLDSNAQRTFPSRLPSSFDFGPPSATIRPSVAPATASGGFQPIAPSRNLGFGSGRPTPSAGTPRPVSSTTFPATFQPTSTATPTNSFGNSIGSQGLSRVTPPTATFFGSSPGVQGFSPAPPTPSTIFTTRQQAQGVSNFGSFAFGTDFDSTGTGGVTTFRRHTLH